MRPSPRRHTLAVLRKLLGLGQKEIAALIECSCPTIQSIELGNLKMSIKLLGKLVDQTGIDPAWVAAGNVNAPMLDTEGNPYTRATFDEVQAFLRNANSDLVTTFGSLQYTRFCFRNIIEILAILYTQAYRTNCVPQRDFKITEALAEIFREYVKPDSLTGDEILLMNQAATLPVDPKDLLNVVRRFVEDTDQVFLKHSERFQKTQATPRQRKIRRTRRRNRRK